MATIGDRIKEKRQELGLTQTEFGKRINVTDKAVSKWENNNGEPDVSTIILLAEKYDFDLQYLLMGIKPENKIVAKTPEEMIIENDDPTYIDCSEYLTFNDIYKHKLINVFSYLIDNPKANYLNKRRFDSSDIDKFLYMCLITNRLDAIQEYNYEYVGRETLQWSNEMIEAFIDDERVKDETRKFILSKKCRALIKPKEKKKDLLNYAYGNLQYMYSIFLERFILAKKWNWVKYILEMMIKEDVPVIKQRNECKTKEEYLRNLKLRPVKTIPFDSNIEYMLLKEKQFDLLDLVVKYAKETENYCIPQKLIEAEKMKVKGNIPMKDILTYQFLNDGILDYKGLFESKTIEFKEYIKNISEDVYYSYILKEYGEIYKSILLENPIGYIELLYMGIKENDLSKALKVANEFGLDTKVFENGNIDEIIDVFKKSMLNEDLYIQDISELTYDVDETLEYLTQCKLDIFNEWRENVNRRAGSLNKYNIILHICEFERSHLEKDTISKIIEVGGIDRAVYILCSTLESFLNYYYGYGGNLLQMLNQLYESGIEISEEDKDLLNKLRLQRNCVLHDKRPEYELSYDDIFKCAKTIDGLCII